MRTNIFAIIITLTTSLTLGTLPAYAGQPVKAAPADSNGQLELECNVAGVDLHVCPRDQFERKTVRKFFGLFTTHQESCTGEELFLGTTPMTPVELPEGRYVLLVPPEYVREQKDPIEVSVAARQKTFVMLKLFERHQPEGSEGHGGSASAPGGSGGSGSSGSGSSGSGSSGSGSSGGGSSGSGSSGGGSSGSGSSGGGSGTGGVVGSGAPEG